MEYGVRLKRDHCSWTRMTRFMPWFSARPDEKPEPIFADRAFMRVGQITGAALLFTLASTPAAALQKSFGEFTVSLDTTLSYEAALRAQAPDCSNISVVNGGCRFGPKLPTFGETITASDGFPEGGLRTGTRSQNADDGNLNFQAFDPMGAMAQAVSDLEVTWRNFTLFARGLAFYDMVYSNDDLAFKQLNPEAADDLGREARILDLFVSGNFRLGGRAVTVRVGQQVIDWGESLYIPGGINAYLPTLPTDVARLRNPDTELTEGFLPTPAVFVSAEIVSGIDIEAFYQWQHVDSEIDPARSFFSTSDIAGAGGRVLLNQGPDFTAVEARRLGVPEATAAIVQNRFTDQGREDGNFGFSISYLAKWLNRGTRFRGYYVNYTSPLPYFTYQAPAQNFEDTCDLLAVDGLIPDGFDGGPDSCVADPATYGLTAFIAGANSGGYGFDFPDDIEVWGASFNTKTGPVTFAGEVAFYPDLPLQLTDGEIYGQILDADDSSEPVGDIVRVSLLLDAYRSSGGAGAVDAGLAAVTATTGESYAIARPTGGIGDVFQAYKRQDSLTGQVSATAAFTASDRLARWTGADRGTAVLNAGFMWVPDLPDLDEAVIAAPGCEHGHPRLTTALALSNSASADTTPKCASTFSAGYRARFAPTYDNVIGTAWSVTPSIAFRHDVRGRSPGPIGPGFVSGRKQISVGISMNLRNRYTNSIQYTNFKGAGTANALNDRDFLTIRSSISF